MERKLRGEIRVCMGTDDFSYENLKKLHYLDCVQKEVTRVYGPVNWLFPREAEKDINLNGVPISAGTQVNLNHFGIHYSEKYYKDPHVFRPERWEN